MAATVELDLLFVAQTVHAWGVTEDAPDDPVIWLPKSQCELTGPALLGKPIRLEVPEWLATEKGLV